MKKQRTFKNVSKKMLFGSIFAKNIFALGPRIYNLKGKSHVKGGRHKLQHKLSIVFLKEVKI